jgi:hypothetical protein
MTFVKLLPVTPAGLELTRPMLEHVAAINSYKRRGPADAIKPLAEALLHQKELVPVALWAIEHLSQQEFLVKQLSSLDPEKPRLKTDIDLRTLFPVAEITEGQSQDPENLVVEPPLPASLDDTLSLHLQTKTGERLASLELGITNELLITNPSGVLSTELKSLICSPHSGVIGWDDSDAFCFNPIHRFYYFLNWLAIIKEFALAEKLHRSGLGPIWFQNYLLSYLKESGFNLVAIFGTCDQKPHVHKFWGDCGFGDGVSIDFLDFRSNQETERIFRARRV